MKKLIMLVLFGFAAVCFAQTHSLEIHAAIDGEPGYCDSLLSLVGASPGAGTHDIPSGDSIEISLDTTLVEVAPGTRDSCYGWTNIDETGDSTRGEGASFPFISTENTTVVWNFKRQFTFEVSSRHPGYGSPSPPYGINWIDSGDTIITSIDSTDGSLVCIGYNGTGSVPPVGFGYSWTGVIEEPSSIEWEVCYGPAPICSLLVISDHGPCVPTAGNWNYILRGDTITAFASLYDISDSDSGIVYECIGWLGEGCVPPFGFTNCCSLIACDSCGYGIIEWLWDTIYTDISEDIALPQGISINAHPNPFNSAVTIVAPAGAEIEILDVNGRRISVIARRANARRDNLSDDEIAALPSVTRNDGVCEFVWQPAASLSSGVYLVRMRFDNRSLSGDEASDSGTTTKRIVYLK